MASLIRHIFASVAALSLFYRSISGITEDEMNVTKEFLLKLVGKMNFNDDGHLKSVHVGLFTFHDDVQLNFNLTNNLTVIEQGIRDMNTLHNGTNINKALNYAIEKSFCKINSGNRPGVPNIILLLTDGDNSAQVNASDSMDKILQKASQQKVQILSIGIGNDVNFEFLNNLTRNESSVFQVDSFPELGTNQSIFSAVCRDLTASLLSPKPSPQTDFLLLIPIVIGSILIFLLLAALLGCILYKFVYIDKVKDTTVVQSHVTQMVEHYDSQSSPGDAILMVDFDQPPQPSAPFEQALAIKPASHSCERKF